MTALAPPTRASPMYPLPTGTAAPSAPSGPISRTTRGSSAAHAGGKTYHPLAGQKETEPIGSIPQVRRTKGYWESNYALQNECGLSFGESTASALPLTLPLSVSLSLTLAPTRPYPFPYPEP